VSQFGTVFAVAVVLIAMRVSPALSRIWCWPTPSSASLNLRNCWTYAPCAGGLQYARRKRLWHTGQYHVARIRAGACQLRLARAGG